MGGQVSWSARTRSDAVTTVRLLPSGCGWVPPASTSGTKSALTISWPAYFILKFMVSLDYIGLVNIVASKLVVQEFLQGKARPGKIAAEIQRILSDKDYNETMRGELSLIREKLGDSSGTTHVAQLAYDMMNCESAYRFADPRK